MKLISMCHGIPFLETTVKLFYILLIFIIALISISKNYNCKVLILYQPNGALQGIIAHTAVLPAS